MKKLLIHTVIAAFAVMLAGCAKDRPFVKSFEEEQSLVFGNIDMAEAPIPLRWVTMKRMPPLPDKPQYNFVIDRDMFYHTGVPLGVYKFTSFGGRWRNLRYIFPFRSQGRDVMDRAIRKPGLHYVGSYKFKMVKQSGPFQMGQFDLVEANSPSERELLLQLLEKAEHASWKAAIQKRIDALK